MIETFKIAHIKLGRYYIIAPENGCSGTINKNNFETVWQYGSNDNAGGDPLWLQDGVAPQCIIGGLSEGDRVYIPQEVSKGFIDSHIIANYKWILNKKLGENGYVKKRY